jgi:hypothetical protein
VLKFSRPFLDRPRYMFYGLNHANVRNGVNARFACELQSWDQDGVDMRLSTWEEESRYHSMGGSYIALL